MHQLIQSNPAVNVKMVFMEHPDLDLRRYNEPTSRTQVAAIFVGDDGEPPANRDICIYPVADSCKNISPLNQCSDPMVYPLLFPHGECGWNSNMEHVEERRPAKRVRVTQLQYYSYRFAVHILDCSEPFGGKVVLLGGDFRQVLPVVPRGSRSLTVAWCLKKHPLWLNFHVLYLTKNIRALESEKEFSKWLLEVGDGLSEDTIKLPSVCYPKEQDPVKQLYNDLNFKAVTAEQLKGRAMLTVANDLSIYLNNAVLNLIPGREEV
ncbi:hypothetical protein AVEN_229598-1 [Araneus ventricosus]|uniref:ATP-dependent DNA helicase n=1 Tax=Araneus ventricosus TaxID=182803 RepID=A0A4Y2DAC1_ARAVE|nr:hypothetical protein AVEN_229598-1 [Araneus ventricosus]